MNTLPPDDYERNRQQHIFIRIGIVLIVFMVVMVALIVTQQERDNMTLEFKYADATVKWDNETRLMITHNNTSFYEFTIIGETEDGSIRVEQIIKNNFSDNYTLIDVEKMILDNMNITIKITNLSMDVSETQKLE